VTEPRARVQAPGVTTGASPPLPETHARPPPEFRALYEAESSYVWATLRRLGVRDADLEDMSLEAFVVVHKLLPQFDPTRPVRPWLFAIAVRVAADYRKSARYRREVLDHAPDAVDPGRSAEEQLAARDDRRLVLAALEALEIDRRAVFVLHELDDHAMPEIAAALAIPLNTAYSRLRLARQDFVAAVQRLQRRKGEPHVR
jgi:RNA polymerase sigma-70 factor (ECF subfamily)